MGKKETWTQRTGLKKGDIAFCNGSFQYNHAKHKLNEEVTIVKIKSNACDCIVKNLNGKENVEVSILKKYLEKPVEKIIEKTTDINKDKTTEDMKEETTNITQEETVEEKKEEICEEKPEINFDTLRLLFVTTDYMAFVKELENTFKNCKVLYKNYEASYNYSNYDYVIVCTSHMKHAIYYGIKENCKNSNTKLLHCSNSNIEKIKELITELELAK